MEEVRKSDYFGSFIGITDIIVPTEEGFLWKGLLDAFDDDDDELRACIEVARTALDAFVAKGWKGINWNNETLRYAHHLHFNEYDCNHLISLWVLLKIQCVGEGFPGVSSAHIKNVKDKIRDLFYFDDGCGYQEFHPDLPGWIRFCKVEELVRRFVRGKLLEGESKEAYREDSEHKGVIGETNTVGQLDMKLSDVRQKIYEQLHELIAKGEWEEPANVDNMTQMIKNLLGVGTLQDSRDKNLSEDLWHLLQNGRGDRVRVVWQNIAGFLASHKFLNGTSPELCRMFFDDSKDYTNIDKGRKKELWSKGFASVVPLIEKYMPKQ